MGRLICTWVIYVIILSARVSSNMVSVYGVYVGDVVIRYGGGN